MKQREFSLARWALAFFVPMAVVICLSAVFNYFVDPLWQWDHPHHLERWHRGFNERIQKTNYLASHNVNIDTLILGSSRSTCFRPEWLGSEYGFNYATSDGRPFEFAERIDYAKKRSGIPLKLVMVEAWEAGMFEKELGFEEPSYYIENAENESKKIKSLFNLSAFGHALETRKRPVLNYYFINRLGEPEYKLSMQFASANGKLQAIATELEKYGYGKGIYTTYDEGYSRYLSEIHRAVGDAELVVYTSPVSWQHLKLFVEMGLLEGYEEGLRELVAEFGKVYHFFYPNGIAMDNDSFSDTNHPTGETAELIISIIMRLRSGEIEEDTEHGGILLTQENIEELLPRFREEMLALQGHSPSSE